MKTSALVLVLALLTAFLVFPINFALAEVLLSQNSITLAAGSNTTISINTSTGTTANVTFVSNSNVAYSTVNGNVATIYGLTQGFTEIRFCTYDNACATLNVTVSSGGSSGIISFNPNSVTMSVGENRSVTIFNSTGSSLYISSNSNANVVSASLDGGFANLLRLFANQAGSSTITVCSSVCANLNVTVNSNSQKVTLSQSTFDLNLGQSISASIFGGYSSYYIYSNSNSSIVSTSISGSTLFLNVSATNSGSANLVVCQALVSPNLSADPCAYAFVSVRNNSGTLYFLTTGLVNPPVGSFYTAQLQVSGGTSPYVF